MPRSIPKYGYVEVYNCNRKQPQPCHDREHYEKLRHQIRRLRKAWSKHPDVRWFAESLGIEDYDSHPIQRTSTGPYHSFIGITGPVGRLP